MQPNYGPPYIHAQQFVPFEDCCPSIVLPFPNPPQNLHHSIHHPYRPPFRQLDDTSHPQFQHAPHPAFFPVKFKLGNGDEIETSINFPKPPLPMPSLLPQQDYTLIKESFEKQQRGQPENEEQHFEGNKSKNCKFDENNRRSKDLGNKQMLLGELEAIYSLAKVCGADQTGSGSALTGENSPKNGNPLMSFHASDGQITATINNGSENCNGEEAASLKKSQKRTKKRKSKENLSSMVEFIEKLVKQIMVHQEMLHKKFLQVIERMEKESREREEERRRQEAEKHKREAISRAREQSLACSREAEIVSYLEKITGKSINLPVRKEIQPPKKGSNRWPKAEVEALIQARSSIETKFQDAGMMMKDHFWEEISSLMVSMGYRSSKRCKEKWESINPYLKKDEERGKNRSDETKTCSYFSQLDPIHSVTSANSVPGSSKDHIDSWIWNSSDPFFGNKNIADDEVKQRSQDNERDMYSKDEDEHYY